MADPMQETAMRTDPNEFDFFSLDVNRLDEEWVNQPRLYHVHATRLADARADYEHAKSARDAAAAEIDRDIRLNPSAFGISCKITEALVEKTILLQRRYRQADEAVIRAKHTVDVLLAVVEALDHRKKALESLVQLEARDYFASCRAPANSAGGRAVRERQADRAFGSNRAPRQ